MNHIFLFLLALLSSYTSPASSSSTNDFCVANLDLPNTPFGYQCKSETKVTSNDFLFSGLTQKATTKPFNVGITFVNATSLPGLNGLGISAARIDFDVNGAVPMHIHPDASEFIIIIEGKITAGFITPTNFYEKTLIPGDIFVFPKGLFHYQVNSGVGKAVAFVAYSSSNPSTHLFDVLLFGNTLSTPTIARTTLLDDSEIWRLKALFGGSG